MATSDLTEAQRPVVETVPRKRRRPGHIFAHSVIPRIILIAAAFVFITPFYWMLISAVKSNQELTHFPPTLFPSEWHWENFVDAVNYIPFGLYALNSTIITVGITIGSLLSHTVVAYDFS